MSEKDEVARLLADAHREIEPAITRIIRSRGNREPDAREPLKLLEVNPTTSPSGVLPTAFGPDPLSVPYPSVVVKVAEEEYDRILRGELALPAGWSLGETLYPAAA
jgi:hypothetical protein